MGKDGSADIQGESRKVEGEEEKHSTYWNPVEGNWPITEKKKAEEEGKVLIMKVRRKNWIGKQQEGKKEYERTKREWCVNEIHRIKE